MIDLPVAGARRISGVPQTFLGNRKMKKARHSSREGGQRSDDHNQTVRIRGPRTGGYLTVLTAVKKPSPPDRAWLSAKIESAGALSGNLKARVRANLVRIYGPLRISFVEITPLVGGMRITVGNDLYCGGVRDTLEALELKH